MTSLPGAGGEDRWRDGELFDPRGWLAVGFSLDQARVWHRWRIDPLTAVAWRAAGVPDGLSAAQWSAAGVRPDTVGRWRAAGIEASEAVHWHEVGYDLTAAAGFKRRGLTPNDAINQGRAQMGASSGRAHPQAEAHRRFVEAGARPELAYGYIVAQWVDDEALDWARAGVDAPDARLWRLLGLTPPEALRLASRGAAPDQMIRDWWRAGIPYDEVAAWLGAGLSPHEAAAQRAQGIAAEQAATMRALRDDDDPNDDPLC
jgi:hypothetical protein